MQPLPLTLPPTLPIVVQIGFAGSRMLLGPQRLPPDMAIAYESELLDALVERLATLPARLGLSPHHLLCGVSQVAIGADTLFTRALIRLGLPQRVLLPQPPEAFLMAGDPADPDFTPAERQAARALLASPHLTELRVASDSDDRVEQFEDANHEILRESDVVVCLVREGAAARPGGTRDLMQRAAQAGKPVLLLEASLREGRARLSPWLAPEPGSRAASFVAPGMPTELAGLSLPAAESGSLPGAVDYIDAVRRFASAKTRRHSGLFKRAAIAIIMLHIGATLLAALAGKLEPVAWVALLLSIELVLLGAGLGTHHALHRSAAARSWAVTRLLAETLRSMKSVSGTAVSLDYARALALPASFQPLLRTAAVLHGLAARRMASTDWAAQRTRYLDERLTGAGGQLDYFARASRAAARRHALAHWGFWVFSAAAFGATAAKLGSVAGALPGALAPVVVTWGGLLAITLPVAAVGFLSWSAAADLEARAATYAEMHAFLAKQVERLRACASARDFARAVCDTELGILGENLSWFSRRLFKGVA